MQLAQQEAKLYIRDNASCTRKIGIIEFENGVEINLDLESNDTSWVTTRGTQKGTNQDIVEYLKNTGFNLAFWKRIMIKKGKVSTNHFKQLFLTNADFYFLS